MNLKKVKENGKALVGRLLKEVDSIVDATPHEDRAEKVEKYSTDLNLLVEDKLSTQQDVITTIEEVIDEETKRKLEEELSDKMGWPESLDKGMWDYIQHTSSSEEEVTNAYNVVITSPVLQKEDKVIVVDEILSAYE